MKKQTDIVTTTSGIEIKGVYHSSDTTPNSESPGQFPFTRGIHPTMYRGRQWTMRQYAGFGTADEANARYKFLLSQGTSGLSVAFDLPTQMGRDPDHALARGEVGRVGVSIASVEDMKILFAGIPLSDISTSMTINATAGTLLAFYLVAAEEQGVAWHTLRGTVQNDVLKEYLARGTYIYPPRPALRLSADLIAFCTQQVPEWNSISISGYHIREAGSTAVQELAFTFANAITYVDAVLQKGLDVDTFAPRLAFFFNCHNEFFEEVAKFRAARRIWANIMRDRFKAKQDRSLLLRFHTQTAGSSLTAQQPLNNVVRTTMQAFAAVCGGTQSLHTNSFDEALGLPTEASATLALRTQQIIANETGVAAVADPLGGSYFVENLTTEIETRVLEMLGRIERLGGMPAAIDAGVPQAEIEEAAFRYQQQIETNERLIVGVNSFVAAEPDPQIATIDPRGEELARERLKTLKAQRDSGQVEAALNGLKKAAQAERTNVLPHIVDAARARATLGEIADVLRGVFGEFRG
jgi:methylmalonyl-CoA mutase N-terminal domain/subunit